MLTGGRHGRRAASAALVALGAAAATSACSTAAGPSAAPPAKVAPRWEAVATLGGAGEPRTARVEIAAHAIQWRVTAECAGGSLSVRLAGEQAPLVEPPCPGRGFGFSIRTGAGVLEVTGTDRWTVNVDQQVDTPIDEPALPGMVGGARLAAGSFYGIDQRGAGRVVLYRLPDGRRALRLDDFAVTANTDLFLWVSEASTPRTSAEVFGSAHVELERLKASGGPQNYLVPESVATSDIRSVVVWCAPVRTAYAAATMTRVD